MNFIELYFEDVPIYAFNSESNKYEIVDDIQLSKIIAKRFDNLKANDKRKKKLHLAKQLLSPDDVIQTMEEPLVYSITKNNIGANYMLNSFKDLYKKKNQLAGYDKWNFYSMFHSMYQPFSIVLYNMSHKLNNNSSVHQCTRVYMTFPDNANCILIIHGRLVHSGASSKLEVPNSFNTSHDVRLFAYLSNLKKRKDRTTKYKGHLDPDKVDTATFKLCENDCCQCKRHYELNGKQGLFYDIINVEDYLPLSENTSRIQQTPKRILGDMDELGWEIWTGVDMSLPKYTQLQSHLREMIQGHGKNLWNGINSTQRKAFKIDKLLGEENHSVVHTLDFMCNVYDDILSTVLKQVDYLGPNIQMDARAVLANFDRLNEQRPHRDFSSVKK